VGTPVVVVQVEEPSAPADEQPAAACTGSGRYALKTTIGSPKANRLVACPRPQESPRRAAVRAARSRPVAISVVTAAK